MAREIPQHVVGWAPQDYETSKVHLHVLRKEDWALGYMYRMILDKLASKGGSLPADPVELAATLGMPEEQVERCLPILVNFGKGRSRGGLIVKRGLLTNRRVTEDRAAELERRRRLSEGGRNGGLRSAQARLEPGQRRLNSPTLPSSSPLPLPTLPSPTLPIPEGAREQAIPEVIAEKAFEALLGVYPPGAVPSKFAAQHAFSEVLPWLPSVAELLDIVKEQKRSDGWRRGKVPSLDKWLRERRWTGTVGAGDSPARGTSAEVDEQLARYAAEVDG